MKAKKVIRSSVKETPLNGVSLNAHLISFIASLRKMKENEVMTDVTLILPDQSAISCHKVILTAGCSLFRSLKESAEQEIRLDFADSNTIRTLIEFPYSGFVNMTDDHLMTLVAASTRLCHKNAANSLIGLHVMSFMTSLHEMKERQVMTDVTLILPDQSTISCHKVVLMATSIFFETMFQSGLKESAEKDVRLDFADSNTIKTTIEFFYTGFIKVTTENVKALSAASDFLWCKHLKAHCDEFLKQKVNSSNYIDLYHFGKMFNMSALSSQAHQHILFNFKSFCEMPEFYSLTEDGLVEIVSEDELNVETEEIVIEAVVSWLNVDPDVRKGAFARIASHIRFPFCSLNTLTSNECLNKLVLDSGCMQLLHEALRSPYHRNCHHAVHNARFVPRAAYKGKKQHLIRMIRSGIKRKITFVCTERIDERKIEWENLFSCVYRDMVKHIITSSSGLFLVGEDDQCVRFQADRDRKTLTSIPWKPPRQSSTLCFFGGKIFAFGGCTIGENTPLKFVASFNVEDANPDWRLEKEMLIAIEEPCVVHFADKMFVFGGRIGNTFSVVSQEFDPISNEWRLLSEMPGPCHSVAAVALNNKIYVVGGLNRVCYSFDPVNDEWKSLSPPTQLCLDGSATVWKGKILLSAYLCTSLVQEYDPATDRWSKQNQLTAHEPQQYFLFSLCY